MADPIPPVPSVLETADLARRLRETEAELARVTTRLRRLESSTAVQIAKVMIAGAHDPRRAPITVPRELVGLGKRWRARGGNRTPTPLDPPAPGGQVTAPEAGQVASTATPDATVAPPPADDELGARLLSGYALSLEPRTRATVAAIVAEAVLPRLRDATHLTRLRPDDAVTVMTAASPTVLLVDVRAADAGIWSHLGTYAAPERERTLLDLLHAASGAGIKTVLWSGEDEPAAGWADLAPLFDSVVIGDAAALIEEVAA